MSWGDKSDMRRPFATRTDICGSVECTAGMS
jgi:hypothetical protein